MSTAYVIFGDGTRLHAEVADGEDARARGLMFRELSAEAAMLFVFDRPGRYAFWMKNVPMPLDIIWVNESRRVVWIAENASPCSGGRCPVYEPPQDALFVVEVAAGFARRHLVAIGDRVTIRPQPLVASRTSTPDRC